MADGFLSGSLDSERERKKDYSMYEDHCLLDHYNNLQGQGDGEKSILIKKFGIFY